MKAPTRLTVLVAILALIGGPMLGFAEVFASDPFLAEILMFGGNFAPRGWAFCDGQLLSIASYSAVFSLMGTTFGGDGRTTFGLPDLRGRVAIHPGTGPGLSPYSWGQRGGIEKVTLTTGQLPSHTHAATLKGTSARGTKTSPDGNTLANDRREDQYAATAPNVSMSGGSITVGNTGGGQQVENRQPYLAVYHIIALQGTFPSRN